MPRETASSFVMVMEEVQKSSAVPGDAPSLALSYIRRPRVRAYDLLLAEAREDVLSLGPQDPDRRAISSKGLWAR